MRNVAHLGQHPCVHIQRVCVGKLKNRHEDAGLAVEQYADILALGSQLDAADVSDANQPTVVSGFDDDILELFDLVESAERAERDCELLVVANRRIADQPRGNLGVLFANCAHHVARGQTSRR